MRRRFRMLVPFCLILGALTMTGCSRPQAPAPPVAATPPAPATPPAAPFQPYALITQPPPKPKVATHRNEVLHLTHRAGQVYLADGHGHFYRCGRDRQGRVFPIYEDPRTHVTYPLYYDRSRDRLYRLARNDDGHYYRGYVGDPDNRFYRDDPDYERIGPNGRDRPIVTDSFNRYNYNSDYYGSSGYHGYRAGEGTYYPPPPPAHHGSGFNANWLWAVPVIIGAYLLLNPHHHSSPPPPPTGTVIVQRHGPPTIINRTRNITIVHTNNTVINRNNNVVINRPVPNGHLPYRPLSAVPVPVPHPVALVHHPRPPRPAAPTRPHTTAQVTPVRRPGHHAARPRPVPPPVRIRPAVQPKVFHPRPRPKPAVVPVPQHPRHRRPVVFHQPRPISLSYPAPARSRLVPRPHRAPRPRVRPVIHSRPIPSRPRPVARPHPASQPVRPQVHPAARSHRVPRSVHARPAARRPMARPAPPVVRHTSEVRHSSPAPRPRRAAPSHPALRPASHPRPTLRPAPQPKRGNGKKRK